MRFLYIKRAISGILAVVAAISITVPTFADSKTEKGAENFAELFEDYSKKQVEWISKLDIKMPQSLQIAKPEPNSTGIYNIDSAKYFIAGASNPEEALYLNDKEVERRGAKGVFGVLVDLEDGENIFKFTQDSDEQEIKINRNTPTDSGGTKLIRDIVQDSMFPLYVGGTNVGKSLPVTCIGPAGATIIASIGGNKVELTQSVKADKNVPVRFNGSLHISGDFEPDKTVNVGAVTYTMELDSDVDNYQSSGDVYIAGKDTYVAVRVKDELAYVYNDLKDFTVTKEIVKKGAADYLTTQTNSFVGLFSGGYIKTEAIEVIEGLDILQNSISGYESDYVNNTEKYIFSGTKNPIYNVEKNEAEIKLHIYNSELKGSEKMELADKSLFSSVAIEHNSDNNFVTYTFALNDNDSYWGYSVGYANEGNLIFSINHKPKADYNPKKPLKGINITLDPGHGGSDMGTLGLGGPSESGANLNYALVLANKLEFLGAEVKLTRENDDYLSLTSRMAMHEDLDSDLFISLHHNSVGVEKDANEANGFEIYYNTEQSKIPGEKLIEKIETSSIRKNRGLIESYYHVTLMEYSPSMLVELGFMSNPLEYESINSVQDINEITDLLAAGIVDIFKPSNVFDAF